jgi:class 3 adenylate cyclase
VASDELTERLEAMGLPAEAIAAAIERGDPAGAVFESVLMPGRAERTVSLVEIEARGGLPVDRMQELIAATGLPAPRPDEPCMSPEEAAVFERIPDLVGVWPASLQLQVMRVYGRLLGRIAQAETQAFRLYAEPALRDTDDPEGTIRAIKAAFEALLPMADPLITGIHRRWVEHELAQAAVSAAEQRSDALGLPGSADVTFVFLDLKDFTQYSSIEGDAAGLAAIDRFSDVVTRARGYDCRLTKALGDGFMLVYGDPMEAVRTASEVVDAMRDPSVPGVHASAHRGIALAREGDYFGGAVNLAARLLAAADGDELVATDTVVESTRERFDWEPAGHVDVRGVAEPVRLHRLAT